MADLDTVVSVGASGLWFHAECSFCEKCLVPLWKNENQVTDRPESQDVGLAAARGLRLDMFLAIGWHPECHEDLIWCGLIWSGVRWASNRFFYSLNIAEILQSCHRVSTEECRGRQRLGRLETQPGVRFLWFPRWFGTPIWMVDMEHSY